MHVINLMSKITIVLTLQHLNIPDPLIRHILSYFAKGVFNNKTLREAVNLYLKNEEEAMKKYGHINTWDTSLVTDMSKLFYNKTTFNRPIGKWNTRAVTDMSYMFYEAEFFNQYINSWDTSNVKNMSHMFFNAHRFNRSLDKWKTSNVTNMSHMFCRALSFNQSINN